jgi:hypothetical protein
MPDWNQLVRARLWHLDLRSNEMDAVVVELAAHLEERFTELRLQGVSFEDAVQRSLEQVPDWNSLAKEIHAAKTGDFMNLRTRTLWLPGVLTLTLSMGFLLILQFSGLQPHSASWGSGGPLLLFYIPWLVSLPLFGALGAFLSMRAGGSRRMVLLCSIFPAVYQAVCFFVILPLALVFNRNVALHFHSASLFPQIFAWLILPITALFIGGLGLLSASRGPLTLQ